MGPIGHGDLSSVHGYLLIAMIAGSVVCLGKEAKVKKKGERDAHSLLLWSQ